MNADDLFSWLSGITDLMEHMREVCQRRCCKDKDRNFILRYTILNKERVVDNMLQLKRTMLEVYSPTMATIVASVVDQALRTVNSEEECDEEAIIQMVCMISSLAKLTTKFKWFSEHDR